MPSRALSSCQGPRGWLQAIALATFQVLPGCSEEAPAPRAGPSFLFVEIINVGAVQAQPGAIMVMAGKQSGLMRRLCVNVQSSAMQTAATLLLRREVDQDPTEYANIAVTAFAHLDGQEAVSPGKEFPCPEVFGNAVPLSSQGLQTQFCRGDSRRVVFYVGTQCNCTMLDDGGTQCGCTDGACGAGLSLANQPCKPGECCQLKINNPCALDAAYQ